jgi:hypothetical protein
MGENYLKSMMKKMAEKGGLQGRKTNHSARKTTCTKLLHGGVAPTTIQQLTGHKNVQSINNYAKASLQMQEQMSDILSDNQGRETTGNKTPTTNLAIQIPRDILPMPSVEIANHNQMSEIISKNTCQFSGKIFQNASLINCSITIINQEKSPAPKKRRIRSIIDSDSE